MYKNVWYYSSSDYQGIYLGFSTIDLVNNVIDSSYTIGLHYLMSNGRIDSNTISNNGTGMILVGNFDSKITSSIGYNNITNNEYKGICTKEYSNPTINYNDLFSNTTNTLIMLTLVMRFCHPITMSWMLV